MSKAAIRVLEAVLEVGVDGVCEPWDLFQVLGSEPAARGLAELEAAGLAEFGPCGRVYAAVPAELPLVA